MNWFALNKFYKNNSFDNFQFPDLYIGLNHQYPGLSFPPPTPMPGQWIETALYFANNWNDLRSFLGQIVDKNDLTVQKAKEAVDNIEISQQLQYIQRNFAYFPLAMRTLKTRGIGLTTAYQEFNRILSELDDLDNQMFSDFLRGLLKRNSGLNKILEIVLSLLEPGDENCAPQTSLGYSREELLSFTFAPLVLCSELAEKSPNDRKRKLNSD